MSDHKRGILADMDASDEAIAEVMGEAVFDAMRTHKAAGVPIAVWDWDADRVVLIPADEIVIPGETEIPNGQPARAD